MRRVVRSLCSSDKSGTKRTRKEIKSMDIQGDIMKSDLTEFEKSNDVFDTMVSGRCFQTTKEKPESYYSSEAALKSYIIMKNEVEEYGCIHFQFTCLEEAAEESRRRKIPIFCLEAEIPGDIEAGSAIFSHPLLVEAVECMFVVVAPTSCSRPEVSKFIGNYSYTRVRVLDDSLVDIVPFVDLVPAEQTANFVKVLEAMFKGIIAYRHSIPTYLELLREEQIGLNSPGCSQAVVGTHDAKRCEVEIASLDGILASRTGWWRRQQVVQVTYDSKKLSYCRLVRYCVRREIVSDIYYQTNEEKMAAKMEVARLREDVGIKVFVGFLKADIDPKSALRSSPLRFVPLTDLQATKMNRMVHNGIFNEAVHLLSPRQGRILMHAIQRNAAEDQFNDVVDIPVAYAWDSLCEQLYL